MTEQSQEQSPILPSPVTLDLTQEDLHPFYDCPWLPACDADGNYVWQPGNVGVLRGCPATLDFLFQVVYRFTDGRLLVAQLFGMVRLQPGVILATFDNNAPLLFNTPGITVIPESDLDLPSSVGFVLDTPAAIDERAVRLATLVKLARGAQP